MRTLTFKDEFDAVVNWFTSFGYFDRTENDAVLVGLPERSAPAASCYWRCSTQGTWRG